MNIIPLIIKIPYSIQNTDNFFHTILLYRQKIPDTPSGIDEIRRKNPRQKEFMMNEICFLCAYIFLL